LSNRMKSFLVILAGVILLAVGVVVSILLYQRLSGTSQSAGSQEEVVKMQVVVVTRDLFLGEQLKTEDVKTVELPVEFAPRDAISNTDEAVGKFIKTDLVTGEMVLAHNLASPTNSNHDLSFIIDIFATFKETIKTVPDNTTTTTTTGTTELPVERTFTVDAFQKVSITALVLEIIDQQSSTLLKGETGDQATAVSTKTNSYLLALDPQDALVLKHLKDTDATFDFVLRAPTSTVKFELTPVTEEYIIEFYGLEILP
jgi:pilus assembly protein CpaB